MANGNKPKWQEWDEFLISAWEHDTLMFMATWQFLALSWPNKTPQELVEELKTVGASKLFAELGINSRSPKNSDHTSISVKSFFYQFLRPVNDLLWDGKKNTALVAMRKYRITETQRFAQERELASAQKFHTRGRKHQQGLPIMSGTNEIRLYSVRPAASDWNTVKPNSKVKRIR